LDLEAIEHDSCSEGDEFEEELDGGASLSLLFKKKNLNYI